MRRRCESCHKQFNTTKWRTHNASEQRFCSETCRKREENRRWYQRKNENRVVFKQYGTCEWCGADFARPVTTGRKPKYCSEECRREADKNRRAERRRTARAKWLCENCGATLKNGQRKYCNKECENQFRFGYRDCVQCGERYLATYDGQRCCCRECAKELGDAVKHRRAMLDSDATKVCERCGEEFAPSYYGQHALYCDGCRKEIDQSRGSRRKKLYRATGRDPINREAVFERDKWVCQLCGKSVNPNCAWPHPMSPSIDHIIPLSQGGKHTMRNVQLAHLECNCKRGDREPAQVRIFG